MEPDNFLIPDKPAVLVSIHPKYCDLIFSGDKRVELRKTKPKVEPPFKVYVYQTYPKCGDWNERAGKVVGEFICDFYDHFVPTERGGISFRRFLALHETRLSFPEVLKYLNGKTGFGWHIWRPRRFDRPMELNEFERWENPGEDIRPCQSGKHCEHLVYDYSEGCQACAIDFDGTNCPYYKVTRAPQSWCYVEAVP